MVRRYEISDADWKRIEPLLKGKEGDVGRSGNDNRLFINAVVWVARSGAAWRDVPERYGPAPAARLELGLPTIPPLGQVRSLAGHL